MTRATRTMVRYKKTCNRMVAPRIMHEGIVPFYREHHGSKIFSWIYNTRRRWKQGGGDDQVRVDPVIPEEPPVIEVASGGDADSVAGGGSPTPLQKI